MSVICFNLSSLPTMFSSLLYPTFFVLNHDPVPLWLDMRSSTLIGSMNSANWNWKTGSNLISQFRRYKVWQQKNYIQSYSVSYFDNVYLQFYRFASTEIQINERITEFEIEHFNNFFY